MSSAADRDPYGREPDPRFEEALREAVLIDINTGSASPARWHAQAAMYNWVAGLATTDKPTRPPFYHPFLTPLSEE